VGSETDRLRSAQDESAPLERTATSDVVDRLLGVSDAMVRVRDQIRRLARFPSVPVLILGEAVLS
jgi:transcriptional regulator with AAA-type ATPase domain